MWCPSGRFEKARSAARYWADILPKVVTAAISYDPSPWPTSITIM
jgi:hypothetical protein